MTDVQKSKLEAALRFVLAICVLAVAVAVSIRGADACGVYVEDRVAATCDPNP